MLLRFPAGPTYTRQALHIGLPAENASWCRVSCTQDCSTAAHAHCTVRKWASTSDGVSSRNLWSGPTTPTCTSHHTQFTSQNMPYRQCTATKPDSERAQRGKGGIGILQQRTQGPYNKWTHARRGQGSSEWRVALSPPQQHCVTPQRGPAGSPVRLRLTRVHHVRMTKVSLRHHQIGCPPCLLWMS